MSGNTPKRRSWTYFSTRGTVRLGHWHNVHGFSQAKVNGKGYLVAKEPRLNGSDYGFVIDYQKGLIYILYLDQYLQFVQGGIESVLKDAKPIN